MGVIAQDHKLVDQGGADDSQAQPASGRGGYPLRQCDDPAFLSGPSGKDEVFHDRGLREPAYTQKVITADKYGLIAIRKLQKT